MITKQKFEALVGITMLLLIQACSNTSVREHPSLESQLETIDSVVIAPPAVNITMITFSGSDEQLHEEEASIKDQLVALALARLETQGFDVVEFDFASATTEDDEFAYAVEQVREGYKAAKRTLYDTQMVPEADKRKFKSTVGEVANQVGDKTGADAILLIEYVGTKDSPGKVAQEAATSVLVGVLSMGTVISIPQSESATATVALIDTTTGEVLWSDLKIGLQLDTSVAGLAMGSMPADIDPAINEAVVTNEIATTDVANASRTETTVEDNAAESAAMECAAGQAC